MSGNVTRRLNDLRRVRLARQKLPTSSLHRPTDALSLTRDHPAVILTHGPCRVLHCKITPGG